jgi:cell wall-associated NlpC family hydrolase
MSKGLLKGFGAAALATLTTLTGACASSGAVPHPFPMTAARPAPPAPPAPPALPPLTLVDTALTLRGAPYRNGGADPNGFDCSGFTQYVFAQYGVPLPRAVRDQFKEGNPVGTSDIAAGDLLFFTTTEPGASHVAIAVDADEFVHAPSSTGIVRVERLSVAYWAQRFLGARRVTPP